MGTKQQLDPDLLDGLNEIMRWLDDLTVDPRCDDFSSREIAKAVRTLVPVVVRRSGLGTEQVNKLLSVHESTDNCATRQQHKIEYSNVCEFAKMLTAAFVRLGSEALSRQELGQHVDAAGLAGMSMVLKAVALSLTNDERSPVGLMAIAAWAGQNNDDSWQELLQNAEPPFDLLDFSE